MVIVRPNADTAHGAIGSAIDTFCETHPRARAVTSLPRRAFLSLLRRASAMVGNSSAGLVEAPSLGIPAVNIGERQAGRLRAANVIDCPARAADITVAIQRAISPAFKQSLSPLINPYGDGRSGPRIAQILAETPLDPSLIRKCATCI
jgi:UDP-N-acetylglucosamine 2-epimerase (non-hydrolysing)/GDP/UDP-N,N'-diacetylbacillosamine 2-epimerase (hydrolysing)